MNTDVRPRPAHKPRPLIDLLVSIVIPSVVLMKFSGDHDLGVVRALLLALAFPLGWGLFELAKYRKFNFIALLGLVSVLLTGGIGLFELSTEWLAVKEAAIPGLIGVGVLVSTRTRYPLVRTMLFNPAVLDVERVRRALEAKGTLQAFEARLLTATYLLSATFFFSSFMNYVLATWIVTSPTGTQAFNEELGHLTLVSYPMIAVPAMLMMMGLLYYLVRAARQLTGLTLTEMLNHGDERS
jgi:intracellular septation protein A